MKMKRIWKLTAISLCMAYPVIAVSPPGIQSFTLSGATADDVIEHYNVKDPQSAEDYFTLALAQFGKMSMKDALESANRALPLFKENEKKALCYQLVAQCYGALGDYPLAARAATAGQQLLPDSRDLAALRIAYYKQMGDELNYTIASEHLMRLDPVYRKDPKCEPVTGAIIIVGILCLAGLTALFKIASEDPETQKNLVKAAEHMAELGASLAMLALAVTAKGAK